jgi:hypothetical protein
MPSNSVRAYQTQIRTTHAYKDRTLEEAFPRIVWIILIASIYEKRPLITRYHHLTTSQLLFDSTSQIRPVFELQFMVILRVSPVQSNRAKKKTSTFVVESAVSLDVACQRRIENLSGGENPVEDWAFQTLRVV